MFVDNLTDALFIPVNFIIVELLCLFLQTIITNQNGKKVGSYDQLSSD